MYFLNIIDYYTVKGCIDVQIHVRVLISRNPNVLRSPYYFFLNLKLKIMQNNVGFAIWLCASFVKLLLLYRLQSG